VSFVPPGFASVLSNGDARSAAGGDVDPEQIVGDAGDDGELACALRGRHASRDERREQVVHRARRALELQPSTAASCCRRWRS
jgi:hypothetical protein